MATQRVATAQGLLHEALVHDHGRRRGGVITGTKPSTRQDRHVEGVEEVDVHSADPHTVARRSQQYRGLGFRRPRYAFDFDGARRLVAGNTARDDDVGDARLRFQPPDQLGLKARIARFELDS